MLAHRQTSNVDIFKTERMGVALANSWPVTELECDCSSRGIGVAICHFFIETTYMSLPGMLDCGFANNKLQFLKDFHRIKNLSGGSIEAHLLKESLSFF